MKKAVVLFIVFAFSCFVAALTLAGEESGMKKGEQLFSEHCAACHPNGGNIIDPEDTLQKKTLTSHGIKTADDIVGYLREPGTGMPAFDKEKLPDEQAREIAEYILDTFK